MFMGGEETPEFVVKLYNGTKEATVDNFAPEHTVQQVIDYAVENGLITWPKGGSEEDRGYSIDGGAVIPWTDAGAENLEDNCSLDASAPSTITLESNTVVG